MKVLLSLMIVVVALVLVALALPFLVDLTPYQARYLPVLEEALNRKVSLDQVRLTTVPRLGVRLRGLTVSEDPAFGAAPFASLRSLEIGVKLGPLLSRRVEVEEIILKEPVIALVRNARGVLNISTLGKPRAPGAEVPPPSPTTPPVEGPLRVLGMLAVEDLALTNGRMLYRDQAAATPAEYELRDLEIVLKDVRLGRTPGLHVAAEVLPFKLPLTVDGTFGPLQETLDIKELDLAAGLGKTVFTIKGSAVGGELKLDLASAHIDTAELPVRVPLKRPVQVKDLRLSAAARYLVPPGAPPQDAVQISSLEFDLVLGNSLINVKGSAVGGTANLEIASPLIGSPDLPVDLPLAKPVHVKDLHLVADAKYPVPEGAGPLETVSVRTLGMVVELGGSVVRLKGGTADGDLTVTATSSAINTGDVPVALPLKKPVEIKNLLVAAGLKGDRARLDSFLLTVFGGQVKASGFLTLGTDPWPFRSHMAVQDLQLAPALDAAGVEPVSISGIAAADLDLFGQGFSLPELTRALEGTAHLVVRNGKIQGIAVVDQVVALLKSAGIRRDLSNATAFSKIESNLSVKSGVVNVASLRIDAHDLLATGSGMIGFDQRVNMKATISLPEEAGKPATARSRLSVPIVITGSIQNPLVALDSAAVGAKVKEALGELLDGPPEESLRKGKSLLRELLGR